MIVSFALKNQIIRRTDYNIVVAQSKNYLRARFDALSDDWIGPITAIFNEYTVLLDGNNECLVPWEVLQNPGAVNVSAFCGDLHTASVATMVVKPSGYTEGETPEPPTPGVYAQLTGLVQNAVDTANSVQQRADAGEFNGKDGTDGKDGANGQDGYSPIADVQQTTGGATITITDKTGTTTANIYNGRDGVNGENGADGVSPIATVEQADDGVVITITDKSGTTTATAHNGRDGTDGVDGLNAPQIDDTQASPANPWSGQKISAELANKVNTNQGAENAGKVLGIGDDGSVVPVDASSGIDDTAITTENPWSSQKIVDTVCPPFEVTGPAVTCSPLVDTPLHVVSQIVPVQEGEGDPSPENVRPITGWTEANLWRGGKNLWDNDYAKNAENWNKAIYYYYQIPLKPHTTYTLSLSENNMYKGYNPDYDDKFAFYIGETPGNPNGNVLIGNSAMVQSYIRTSHTFKTSDKPYYANLYIGNMGGLDGFSIVFDELLVHLQIEEGESRTSYEPYNPSSKTIALPFGQTVYGGTLDWNTGILTVKWKKADISDPAEYQNYAGKGVYFYNGLDGTYNGHLKAFCSHGRVINSFSAAGNVVLGTKNTTIYFIGLLSLLGLTDLSEYELWAKENDIEIWYESDYSEETIQLTPQEILALQGTNTIYTDTGDTTVSGLADPVATLQQLAERIDALQSMSTAVTKLSELDTAYREGVNSV